MRRKKVTYTHKCPVCGEKFVVIGKNLSVEGAAKILEAAMEYARSHCG